MSRRRTSRFALVVAVIIALTGVECSRDDVDTPIEVPGEGAHADYSWAVEGTSPEVTRHRLEAYVAHYAPDTLGFEDAVHIRFYRLARYRLLQAYYTAGMIESADRILEQLETTDAEIR